MPTTVADVAMPGRRVWMIVKAFFISPLIVPVVFVSLRVASEGFSEAGGSRGGFEDLASGFLMFTLIAYLATGLLGIPLFWIYQKLGIRSMLAYLAGGFIIALLTTIALSGITGGLFRGDHSVSALARTILVLLGCGGGSGVIFRMLTSER